MLKNESMNWDKKLGLEDMSEAPNLIQVEEGETAFEAEQIKEFCRTSMDALAAICIPAVYKYAFPPVLLTAWSILTQKIKLSRDETRLALGIPRGHAKTMLVKLFVVYCILFTDRKFILVIASTSQRAEDIISDVVDMLNEPNVMKLFGDWKLGREVDRQDLKKFGFRGRNIVLAALGTGGAIRGINVKNERPDVMIFDDIQTSEDADSMQISAAKEKWMIGTAMKAKSPHGCMFIYAGNMFATPYSILKKLKNNPSWIKFISGAILADGTALWPEHRSLQSLIAELNNDLAMGHPEIFFSEVLNDTEAGTNLSVDFAQIKDWPWSPDDRPQGKFIMIDPSPNTINGDCGVIGYFEIYDGIPALREIIEKKMSPGETIHEALKIALRTKTKVIVVESIQYQSTLVYWFNFTMQQLGITGIDCMEIHSTMHSKNSRIATMLKSLTAGEIIIHSSLRSIVTNQISNWSPLRRTNVDGILDVMTYAPKILDAYGQYLHTEEDLEAIEAAGTNVLALEESSSF